MERKLCEADNNTCKNLAENKGRTKFGKIIYGRYCYRHRRGGHTEALRPGNKRYIPIKNCSMCLNKPAVERHRIIQGGEYMDSNVIGLCDHCHKSIHRFYNILRDKGFSIK